MSLEGTSEANIRVRLATVSVDLYEEEAIATNSSWDQSGVCRIERIRKDWCGYSGIDIGRHAGRFECDALDMYKV